MRGDIMLALAFGGIIVISLLLVFGGVDGNTAIGGALIGVLGSLTTEIGKAFSYHFGSSRGSKEKTDLLVQR